MNDRLEKYIIELQVLLDMIEAVDANIYEYALKALAMTEGIDSDFEAILEADERAVDITSKIPIALDKVASRFL